MKKVSAILLSSALVVGALGISLGKPIVKAEGATGKAAITKKWTKNNIAEGVKTRGSERTKVLVELAAPPTGVAAMNKSVATSQLSKQLTSQRDQVIKEAKNEVPSIHKSRIYSTVFSGFSATLQGQDVSKLAKIAGVKRIWPNTRYKTHLKESVPMIGAPDVWKRKDLKGSAINGKGMRVAVVDTGVDATHPDLKGKVIGGYDFVENDKTPQDEVREGHGTHVAGIISANGKLKGVAPGASILAYRVFDKNGFSFTEDILAAIERAVKEKADVINLSLGYSDNTTEDPTAIALDIAALKGTIPVVANGNDGENGNWTVTSPGTSREAISVGASTKGKSGKTATTASNTKQERVADFSSKGPVTGSWAIKPDVIAPGKDITSTVRNGKYDTLYGTSMATPHVAGAAALVKQAHPDWNVREIKAALANTATTLHDDKGKVYPAYVQGSGRIDIPKAIDTQTLIMPSNLSFGKLDHGPGTVQVQRKAAVENLAKTDKSYQVKAQLFNGNSNIKVEVPKSLTVKGNSKTDLNIGLQVGTSLPRGIYTGQIQLQDGKKTLKLPFTVLINPKDYPLIGYLAISPNPFSPNGDGIKDHAVLSWYLPTQIESLNLYATQLDKNGDPARKYTIFSKSNSKSGMSEQVWSGKDKNGKSLPDGIYEMKMTAKDQGREYDKGERSENKETPIIDRTAPTIKMASTFSSAKIKGSIQDLLLGPVPGQYGFSTMPIKVTWKKKGTKYKTWNSIPVTDNDKGKSVLPLSYSFKKGTFSKGTTKVWIRAVDDAGNERKKEIKITIK
ncbi:Serine protease, subtilisin family [Marininema mesophilum]|uniref:Serine protease, subtilisin family n=1 Tax=Marininema mesophilum TaxID=1048340 RepID=A0A1H2XYS6_9BACL|nr:S8 family serine peptidase [Marininema mesophilum]SDW97875.1 Serine protease, subtilisin family [Marininema mesophilum]